MPRYLVEFFGEVEIEAPDETQAENIAITEHADGHVMAIELIEPSNPKEDEEEENDIPY